MVKAIWVVFLIVFPYITALVYLIARGKGMGERSRDAAVAAKKDAEAYIREAAGRSPAQEIADAKSLLEAGTISQQEFDALKAKASASPSSEDRTQDPVDQTGGSSVPGCSGEIVRLENAKPLSSRLSSPICSVDGVNPALLRSGWRTSLRQPGFRLGPAGVQVDVCPRERAQIGRYVVFVPIRRDR